MPTPIDPRILALAPLILPYIGHSEDHPACDGITAAQIANACESYAEEILAYHEDSRPDVPTVRELNKGRKW